MNDRKEQGTCYQVVLSNVISLSSKWKPGSSNRANLLHRAYELLDFYSREHTYAHRLKAIHGKLISRTNQARFRLIDEKCGVGLIKVNSGIPKV